jgi:hypothetical protein
MAQTKRKRRTKHRGNAAGMVETRGRTSRPAPGAAKPASAKAARANKAQERLNRVPTWRSSINRAGLATLFFAFMIIVVFRTPIAGAVSLSAFVFLMYIPLGYYTDRWMYQRRVKKGLAPPLPAKARKSKPKAKADD